MHWPAPRFVNVNVFYFDVPLAKCPGPGPGGHSLFLLSVQAQGLADYLDDYQRSSLPNGPQNDPKVPKMTPKGLPKAGQTVHLGPYQEEDLYHS